MRRLVSPTGKPVVCGPSRPNAGLAAAYQKRLHRLIDDMNASVLYWLTAAYRANPPRMAQDALNPANALIRAVRGLGRRWERNFREAAPKLAAWFTQAAAARSDATLQTILRDGGFTVQFHTTPELNDVLTASINENVALIKSIQAQHFAQIEGMVMRSVQLGGDLKVLTDDLQNSFGVTRRRAAFIASDQNRKATAVVTRVRQQEVGITRAIWIHSGGGNEPRPEHVAWGKAGKTYDIAKGMWSEVDRAWVWPGTAIRCRCVCKSVVPRE